MRPQNTLLKQEIVEFGINQTEMWNKEVFSDRNEITGFWVGKFKGFQQKPN